MFSQKPLPKICLPITSKTKEEIKKNLPVIIGKHPDMIELRADFLANLSDQKEVIDIIDYITGKTDIPLLFTIRSEREGGEPISLSDDEVVCLLCEVAKKTDVAYIDYEVNNPIEYIQEVVATSHDCGKKVIMSYHNFTETPDNNTLMGYFIQMELFQADLAKIAVMPKNKADVLRFLQLTAEANERLHIPVITMSMGEIGQISRVIGWIYGSVLTFGVGVSSSAPGQIPFEQLRDAITNLQQLNKEW